MHLLARGYLFKVFLLGAANRKSDFLTLNKCVVEKLLLSMLGSQSAQNKLLVVDSHLDAGTLLRLDFFAKRSLEDTNQFVYSTRLCLECK